MLHGGPLPLVPIQQALSLAVPVSLQPRPLPLGGVLCFCIALDSAAAGLSRAVHAALGACLCHLLLLFIILLAAGVSVPVLGNVVTPSKLVQSAQQQELNNRSS